MKLVASYADLISLWEGEGGSLWWSYAGDGYASGELKGAQGYSDPTFLAALREAGMRNKDTLRERITFDNIVRAAVREAHRADSD